MRVKLEHDSETGAWGAYLPDLPGVFAAGPSAAEARKQALDAAAESRDWLLAAPQPTDPPCRPVIPGQA